MSIDTSSVRLRAVARNTAGPRRRDRDEAAQLIADLTALLDAGLIAVRPGIHGPARYEAIAGAQAAPGIQIARSVSGSTI